MCDTNYCKMQPDNLGLKCENPEHCERCGWNPAEHQRRRNARLNKIKAKENEKC